MADPKQADPGHVERHDRTDSVQSTPDTIVGQASAPYAPPSALTPPNRGPFGDYDLLEEIGRGGMGLVFKARQRSLGRVVALKMILQGTFAGQNLVHRFQQEARAAAALDHPGIVPIHEFGQINGQYYFTMPFVEGTSLAGKIRNEGPMPVSRAVSLMRTICAAVAHAHARNIIHRDLKPDNILIDREGHPRITDFGLAKLRGSADSGFNMTGTGQILGTPAYMSPEQAMGEKQIGPGTDIYSLGGILYFILTGQAPFMGSSLTDLLFRVVQKPPVPVRQINPDIPADVDALCTKCLGKDPQQRFASADALVQELDRLLGGSGNRPASEPDAWPATISGDVEAPQKPVDRTAILEPTPSSSPSNPPQSPSRAWVLGSVAVGILGVGITLAVWRPWVRPDAGSRSAEPERPRAEGRTSEEPLAMPRRSGPTVTATQGAGVVPDWLREMEKQGKNDFGLKVALEGMTRDAGGVYRLREGQEIRFRIQVDKDAFIGIWTVAPDGKITQLVPTAGRGDYLVKARTPLLIPGEGEDAIVADADPRLERIVVVGSTQPWAIPAGEPDGKFMLFTKVKDQEKLGQTLRGLRVRPGVSQQVLPYQVGPRK